MATITVKVLYPGDYLDGALNPVPAEVGDIVEIFSGPYAERVVAMGAAEYHTADPTQPIPVAVLHEEAPPTPSPAVAEEEETADADPVGALMAINGIGQKTAVKLVGGGIKSVRAFVAADPVELSEIAGTTVAKIQGWQAAAKNMEA